MFTYAGGVTAPPAFFGWAKVFLSAVSHHSARNSFSATGSLAETRWSVSQFTNQRMLEMPHDIVALLPTRWGAGVPLCARSYHPARHDLVAIGCFAYTLRSIMHANDGSLLRMLQGIVVLLPTIRQAEVFLCVRSYHPTSYRIAAVFADPIRSVSLAADVGLFRMLQDIVVISFAIVRAEVSFCVRSCHSTSYGFAAVGSFAEAVRSIY